MGRCELHRSAGQCSVPPVAYIRRHDANLQRRDTQLVGRARLQTRRRLDPHYVTKVNLPVFSLFQAVIEKHSGSILPIPLRQIGRQSIVGRESLT